MTRRIDRVEEWDAYVADAPGATFCHLAAWRDIMADVLGHEWIPLVAVGEDGRWRGVLPLVRVRSRLFGHHLISMPFLNYGGPLGDEVARRGLVDAAIDEARRSGARSLELRARAAVPCALPPGRSKITVLLDLPPDPDALWRDRFPSKLRSQIRRPLKEGMTARFGLDQVEPFYDVFARNMRDLGTPVLPLRFFVRIAERFADRVVFATVRRQDAPVAAGCGFVWRDEFEITWASSLREHNPSAPNMLLYWSLMQRMAERGVRVFNFGRCSPGGGTHRFKRQWGGVDAPLPWVRWSAGGAAPPAPEQGVYRVASAVWRRLPVNVARRLGPFFARGLP
ncbi:MAG TPA: FemAB family XrtA/PEP-CTERM system-associated protein [Longimicrobiales bacterium]